MLLKHYATLFSLVLNNTNKQEQSIFPLGEVGYIQGLNEAIMSYDVLSSKINQLTLNLS